MPDCLSLSTLMCTAKHNETEKRTDDPLENVRNRFTVPGSEVDTGQVSVVH